MRSTPWLPVAQRAGAAGLPGDLRETAAVHAAVETLRPAVDQVHGKDSDGYKVVNCPRAQPVFDRFGRLARGKVISVTVLKRAGTPRRST